MLLARIATAVAASALLAGVAMAQDPAMPSNPDNAPAQDQGAMASDNPAAARSETMPMERGAMPMQEPAAMPMEQGAMPADSAGMNASSGMAPGTAQVVTNGPVADTPENRAMYRPLSNAGRRTATRGN